MTTRPLAANLPGFPAQAKTFAKWPVWKGSTTTTPPWQPISRERRRKIYYDAWRFEIQTRGRTFSRHVKKGRHAKISLRDGAIGRAGMRVLEVLLFDFMSCKTGRLDPCHASIAAKAGVAKRTVAHALAALKAAGVLNWIKRCYEDRGPEGGFLMRQDSNAYAVLPQSQWKGFRAPAEPPPPNPDAWGRKPWDAQSAALHTPGHDGGSLFDAMEALRRRRFSPPSRS